MSWHPNKAKHKAMHGGYRNKPTQQEIKATLSFFMGTTLIKGREEKKIYTQLNLFDEKFGRLDLI